MADVNIGQLVSYYWTIGRRTKKTPSNWISSNAICCTHRGYSQDKRNRGGIITHGDGSFAYSCFNCGFSCSWKPGQLLNDKTRQFLKWLNVSDDDIRKMAFHALKSSKNSQLTSSNLTIPHFDNHDLPPETSTIDENTPNNILNFIAKRKLEYHIDKLYYSKNKKYEHYLIFPLTYYDRIVGWTGRNTLHNPSNRYYSEIEPGYVYGLCDQQYHNKFVIVTEGIIDAIHVSGISIMGSSFNKIQIHQINGLGKPVILVPDRDRNGQNMINTALKNEWYVSLPEWGKELNDISDSVEKYGRLVTFRLIMDGICSSNLKTQLKQRTWFK